MFKYTLYFHIEFDPSLKELTKRKEDLIWEARNKETIILEFCQATSNFFPPVLA